LLIGKEHPIVESGLVERVADPAESGKPIASTLGLVEETPDSLLDQVIGAAILPARKLLLDLLFEIRRQNDFHGRLLSSFYAFGRVDACSGFEA
jgi:hypothetical protein